MMNVGYRYIYIKKKTFLMLTNKLSVVKTIEWRLSNAYDPCNLRCTHELWFIRIKLKGFSKIAASIVQHYA